MTEKEKAIRQFHFVLTDKDNPALVDHMAGLAKQKQLTEEIKIAVELLAQLRNGNRELLDSMFPNICTPKPKPPTSDEISRRLANIEAKLDERQASPIADTRDAGFPAMKQSGSGIGTLNAHTIAMPTFDDDEMSQDTIVLNTAVYQNTGENFIASFAKI